MHLPYMRPKKEWIDTFRLCNEGTILMGNDLYQIIGIGIIKIKMFDRDRKILWRCDTRFGSQKEFNNL